MTTSSARLRIGTRGSRLALWQARHIAERLQAVRIPTEIIIIQTRGDRDQATALDALGDKGLFIKEIEEALLADVIDLAVHSLKDLPTQLPEGLTLAAVPTRVSPLDALISREGLSLKDLRPGSSLATGSLRRAAQIRALRPDLRIVPLRGNVPTRLDRIREGEADATLLAVAGLERLGLAEAITEVLDPQRMTPAMAQGALGIETRTGDLPGRLAALNDPLSRQAVEAERAFMARIGGGCHTPAGVLAEPLPEGAWRLTALLAAPEGDPLMRRTRRVPAGEDLLMAAREWAQAMLAEAPARILEMLHASDPTQRWEV